jgi:hypothetical protein
MEPTSFCAIAAAEKNIKTEIVSAAQRQETLAAMELLDLDLGPLTATLVSGGMLSVTVSTGFAAVTNPDMVERRVAITGKIPILDIRGLSQTKDCSGAMLCASATRFGRGLPGVYTGGFNGVNWIVLDFYWNVYHHWRIA